MFFAAFNLIVGSHLHVSCMDLIARKEVCYMEHHDTFEQVDDLHLLMMNVQHASAPSCHIAV
jgi:hypothetical protein